MLDTSPIDGETVYGTFTALAESGITLPGNGFLPADDFTRISLRIITASRGATVFTARNVDTDRGVSVPALAPGHYLAIWIVTGSSGLG